MVNALALKADEGRDEQRYASGSGKYAEIRRYPNGGTRHREVSPWMWIDSIKEEDAVNWNI